MAEFVASVASRTGAGMFLDFTTWDRANTHSQTARRYLISHQSDQTWSKLQLHQCPSSPCPARMLDAGLEASVDVLRCHSSCGRTLHVPCWTHDHPKTRSRVLPQAVRTQWCTENAPQRLPSMAPMFISTRIYPVSEARIAGANTRGKGNVFFAAGCSETRSGLPRR